MTTPSAVHCLLALHILHEGLASSIWQQFIKLFYEIYKIPVLILGSDGGLWDIDGVIGLGDKTNIKQVGYIIKNA